MSLRPADEPGSVRRYDRGMPVPPWGERQWGERQWDGRPWDERPADGPHRRSRPPAAVVLLVPVVISLLVQVPAAIGIAVWTDAGWAAGLGQVALALVGPLALLGARRFPGPTVAVVAAAALADLLLTPDLGPPYVALAFAIVLAVTRNAAVWAAISTVVAWSAAIVVGTSIGLAWHPFRVAFTTLALAACFGIGWFIRMRRARAAEFRTEALRRRQTAEERERVRIARELHDVIGHALSQINVQASVGLHLMDRDPEQARTALASVKETVQDRARRGAQRARGDPRRRCAAHPAGRARRVAAPGGRGAVARVRGRRSSTASATSPAGPCSSPPTASCRRRSRTSSAIRARRARP